MKDSKDLIDEIFHRFPQVDKMMDKNVEDKVLVYVVACTLFDYFELSIKSEDRASIVSILNFVDFVVSGVDYDDDAKNVFVIDFIGSIPGCDQVHLNMIRTARDMFRGDALFWLKQKTPNSFTDAWQLLNAHVSENAKD